MSTELFSLLKSKPNFTVITDNGDIELTNSKLIETKSLFFAGYLLHDTGILPLTQIKEIKWKQPVKPSQSKPKSTKAQQDESTSV